MNDMYLRDLLQNLRKNMVAIRGKESSFDAVVVVALLLNAQKSHILPPFDVGSVKDCVEYIRREMSHINNPVRALFDNPETYSVFEGLTDAQLCGISLAPLKGFETESDFEQACEVLLGSLSDDWSFPFAFCPVSLSHLILKCIGDNNETDTVVVGEDVAVASLSVFYNATSSYAWSRSSRVLSMLIGSLGRCKSISFDLNRDWKRAMNEEKNFISLAPWKAKSPAFRKSADVHYPLEMINRYSGKGVVVVPYGRLFDAEGEELRTELIRRRILESVVLLPAKSFFGTNIVSALLVLDTNRQGDAVTFINLSLTDCFKTGRQYSSIMPELAIEYMERAKSETVPYAKIVSFEALMDNNCLLDVHRYVVDDNAQSAIDKIVNIKNSVILEDIAELTRAQSLPSASVPDEETELVYEVNASDIDPYGFISVPAKGVQISKDIIQSKKLILQNGDVLFAIKGSVCKVAIVQGVSNQAKLIAGQSFVVIRLNEKGKTLGIEKITQIKTTH